MGLATGTSGKLSTRVDGGMPITPNSIACDTLRPEHIVALAFTGHGRLAFERDLAKAVWLAREAVTLAQQLLICLALGGPRLLPAAEIGRVVDPFSRCRLKGR